MRSKSHKFRNYLYGAIIIVIIVISAIFASQVSNELSALSVSSVNITTEGNSSNNFSGTYWTVALTTDFDQNGGFYQFQFKNETIASANQVSDNTGQYTLYLKDNITFSIKPLQPYWERPLQVQTIDVYPQVKTAHSNYGGTTFGWESPSIDKLSVPVTSFSSNYWTQHCPYDITLYDNGKIVDTEHVDVTGSTGVLRLSAGGDDSKYLILTNIGQLSTGYSAPTFGDIAILSPTEIFSDKNKVLNNLRYSSSSDWKFSNYWFGGGNHFIPFTGDPEVVMGLASDGSPGLYARGTYGIYNVRNVILPRTGFLADKFPGIFVIDNSALGVEWERFAKPQSAKIFDNQPKGSQGTNGVMQVDGLSVVNYLKQYGDNGAQLSTISTGSGGMNVWNRGWEITGRTDSDGQYRNYLKINMPYGSASNILTLQISAKLANAFVYKPQVGNMKFDEVSWVGTGGQIGDSDYLSVKVTNHGTVSASQVLTMKGTDGTSIYVNPWSDTITLGPGESTTRQYYVKNTGATDKEEGDLVLTLTDVTGNPTDTKTIHYSMLPISGQGSYLTVIVNDASTSLPVTEAITVAVTYGTTSENRITENGVFTMDLEGYQGPITLTTVATNNYNSTSVTENIDGGYNTITIDVSPYGYEPPNGINWMLILIVVLIVVLITVVIFAIMKLRKKGGSNYYY